MAHTLTRDDKNRLRTQLVNALHPDARDRLRAMSAAAFTAAIRDYYGDKALKMLAATPEEWWVDTYTRPAHFTAASVLPTGETTPRTIYGPPARVPRAPPTNFQYSAATQALIDAWVRACDEDSSARSTILHHVNSILARASTLDALLKLLPAARDILKLPPAEDPADTAARINAELLRRVAPAASHGLASNRPALTTPAPAAPTKNGRKPRA
jgi:hypothetical protein